MNPDDLPPYRPFVVECPVCADANHTKLRTGSIALMSCPKCQFTFEFDTRERIRPQRSSGYQAAVTHADPAAFSARMRRYRELLKGVRK